MFAPSTPNSFFSDESRLQYFFYCERVFVCKYTGLSNPVNYCTVKSVIEFGDLGGDSLSYFSLLTFNFHSQMPNSMKITRGAKRSNTTSTSVENEIPTQQIQQLHNQKRESLIKGLYNRSIQQLINDFIIEMDAKNKAYCFILESGLFNEFSNYCKKK